MAGFEMPPWACVPPHKGLHFEVQKEGVGVAKLMLDDQRAYILGRNPDMCDHLLEHGSVSRRHAAVINHKDGSVYVQDLGSAQGSFVNDIEMRPNVATVAEENDVFRFAASTRKYMLKGVKKVVLPPTKSVPASEKRKLLWGKREGGEESKKIKTGGGQAVATSQAPNRNSGGGWEQRASQFADSSRQDKFMALMGAKKSKDATKEPGIAPATAAADAAPGTQGGGEGSGGGTKEGKDGRVSQARLYDDLEHQYEHAMRNRGSRGGLG